MNNNIHSNNNMYAYILKFNLKKKKKKKKNTKLKIIKKIKN